MINNPDTLFNEPQTLWSSLVYIHNVLVIVVGVFCNCTDYVWAYGLVECVYVLYEVEDEIHRAD